MTSPARFLTVEDVIVLHAIAIADQGGDPTIRDRGLLEAAVATPQQQFGGSFLHPDTPSMAAAYAYHICLNHPFMDGNKRAGTAAMIAVLADNGWSFEADPDDAEAMIFRLAAGQVAKPAFTEWVAAHAKQLP